MTRPLTPEARVRALLERARAIAVDEGCVNDHVEQSCRKDRYPVEDWCEPCVLGALSDALLPEWEDTMKFAKYAVGGWSGDDAETVARAVLSDCPPEVRAALAALLADATAERAEPQGWQPIATAPKDGTWVLLALVAMNRVVRVSEATFQRIGWYDYGGRGCHWATHWMPLPESPR